MLLGANNLPPVWEEAWRVFFKHLKVLQVTFVLRMEIHLSRGKTALPGEWNAFKGEEPKNTSSRENIKVLSLFYQTLQSEVFFMMK